MLILLFLFVSNKLFSSAIDLNYKFIYLHVVVFEELSVQNECLDNAILFPALLKFKKFEFLK